MKLKVNAENGVRIGVDGSFVYRFLINNWSNIEHNILSDMLSGVTALMIKKNPYVVYTVIKVLDYLRFCSPTRQTLIKDIEKMVVSIMEEFKVSGNSFFRVILFAKAVISKDKTTTNIYINLKILIISNKYNFRNIIRYFSWNYVLILPSP